MASYSWSRFISTSKINIRQQSPQLTTWIHSLSRFIDVSKQINGSEEKEPNKCERCWGGGFTLNEWPWLQMMFHVCFETDSDPSASYVVSVMVLHCCDFSKMRSKKFERASLKVFLIKCYKIPVFNQVVFVGCRQRVRKYLWQSINDIILFFTDPSPSLD